MSDTVGFIRKLPTHLVAAFKATLEELSYADLLLHVIDLSNPDWEAQAEIVDELIRQLGAEQTPCLRVFNKCDAYSGELPHGKNIVCISAKTGEGAAELLKQISELLEGGKRRVELLVPYSDAGLLDVLKKEGAVETFDYTDAGISVHAVIRPELWGRVSQYTKGETMRIETVNLIMRPWNDGDAEALYKFTNDGSLVSGYVRAPHASVDVSRQVIAQILSMPDCNALTLRNNGALVGGLAMFACRLKEHRTDPELRLESVLPTRSTPAFRGGRLHARLLLRLARLPRVWFSPLSDHAPPTC